MSTSTPRSPTRRRFVGAGLALLLYPRTGNAGLLTSVDTVVVGAGAAGLAATRTLRERGASVLLVESSHRIGGRAFTDTSIFGVPYDLGASWLHSAHRNPFVEYGQQNGFDVYPDPVRYAYYVGNRRATTDETAKVENLYRRAYQAISREGRRRRDTSALDAVGAAELDTPWGPTVAAELGAWDMGVDLDGFSALDWWNMEGGEDYFCSEGFGTLVAHYGREVPVSLNTAVTAIDWRNKGVHRTHHQRRHSGQPSDSDGVHRSTGIGCDSLHPGIADRKERII